MSHDSILRSYRNSRDRYLTDLGAHKERVRKLHDLESRRDGYEKSIKVDEMALVILESLSTQAREMVREQIDKIVTTGLQTVFDDGNLGFQTEFERRGDRIEVHFAFMYGSNPAPGPVFESIGGGMVDIAAFLLRVCLFRMLDIQGPIVLDEPFSQVATEDLPRAAELARRLSNDMLDQLIIVSHEPPLADSADNVLEFKSRGIVVNRD